MRAVLIVILVFFINSAFSDDSLQRFDDYVILHMASTREESLYGYNGKDLVAKFTTYKSKASGALIHENKDLKHLYSSIKALSEISTNNIKVPLHTGTKTISASMAGVPVSITIINGAVGMDSASQAWLEKSNALVLEVSSYVNN